MTTAHRTAEDVVNDLHPYGEWSGSHTAAAAAEIAELVRYLNHATQSREALTSPKTVAALLHGVSTALVRMQQLIQQVGQAVDRMSYEPDLESEGQPGHDSAVTLALRLFDPEAELERPGDRLRAFGEQLQKLAFEADRLYLPQPGDDED
jgi:hypothetical protein